MAMNPEKKDQLTKLTAIAKAIVYEPNRMRQFIKMLGTPEGAVTAVKTVLGGIEQKMQIPPDVAPLLAVNAYMIMVDVAQEVVQAKPAPEVMKKVIGMILKEIMAAYAQPKAAPQGQPAQPMAQPQQPQQPAGLLAQGVPA